MRLNVDLIRALLLFIEKNVDTNFLVLSKSNYHDFPAISRYDWTTVSYHLSQLEMSGFISSMTRADGGGLFVLRMLSPSGHEFLENIRQDNNWKKVKKVASKVGTFSLSSLRDIAVSVVSEIIKSSF